MPLTNHSSASPSSPGDDFGSTDEVKVFKDEGEKEDEQQLGENLLEEKSSLIDLTESEVGSFFWNWKVLEWESFYCSFWKLLEKFEFFEINFELKFENFIKILNCYKN